MSELGSEQALSKVSLAEVAEVVWPTNCPGQVVALHGYNVKKVLNCAGDGGSLCDGTVCVGKFLCCVHEDWQSDGME